MSKYVFRRWNEGDRVPSRYTDADYVIFHEGTQVGAAAMGLFGLNNIFFIEIFEPYRNQGHGTVFVGEIEKAVKRLGHDFITAYPVLDETVWIKWGYRIEEIEEDGNKKMKKDLS